MQTRNLQNLHESMPPPMAGLDISGSASGVRAAPKAQAAKPAVAQRGTIKAPIYPSAIGHGPASASASASASSGVRGDSKVQAAKPTVAKTKLATSPDTRTASTQSEDKATRSVSGSAASAHPAARSIISESASGAKHEQPNPLKSGTVLQAPTMPLG